MSLALFLQDRRNPKNALQRVYVVMVELYSDTDPKGWGAWYIGQRARVERNDVYKHWDALVKRGWLVEHPHAAHEPRQFTLATPDELAA